MAANAAVSAVAWLHVLAIELARIPASSGWRDTIGRSALPREMDADKLEWS